MTNYNNVVSSNFSANQTLHAARNKKDDEFYTPYDVTCDELDHYFNQFYGKTIYCPCDDPRWSSFVRYFINNRDKLNNTVYASCNYSTPDGSLTQVTVVFANKNNPANILDRPDYRRARTETEKDIKRLMINNGVNFPTNTQVTILEKQEQIKTDKRGLYLPGVTIEQKANKGDFEKTDTFDLLLSYCDVVVTNPPFSKFRDFIDILIASGKKFLVMGSNIACNFKNVFEYVQAGKLWAGYGCNKPVDFIRPDGSTKGVPVTWYTNFEKTPSAPFVAKNGYSCADLKARGLWKVYDDRPDVLFVKAVADVPVDYDGLVAVPPNAFYRFIDGGWEFVEGDHFCNKLIGGVESSMRIVIRRKPNQQRAIEVETCRRIVETAPAILDANDPRGYIYIIADESNRIKIGVTRNMIEERVNQLQTGNAENLTVLYLSNPVRQYEDIETKAHDLFRKSHLRGEWFKGDCLKDALAFLTHETAPSKQDVERFRNV